MGFNSGFKGLNNAEGKIPVLCVGCDAVSFSV